MIDIYGKDGCPFCTKAVQLCEENGVEYSYFNMSQNPQYKDEMVVRIGSIPKTVPQVFVSGSYNEGGYDGLVEYFSALEIDDLSI